MAERAAVPNGGGAVIAFVGADATGKSTLVSETARWLGESFRVAVVHAGKPPPSLWTAPAHAASWLARRRRGDGDASRPRAGRSPTQHTFRGLSSVPHALRAVALGWDRQRLVRAARRRADRGEIIVCDRYPSTVLGAMDSPRLEPATPGGPAAALYNRLARLEQRLYRRVPPPDIVLRLRVSLATARRRNRARAEQDGEAYLEARHAQCEAWQLAATRGEHQVDTERSLEETVDRVKDLIRAVL